MYRLRRGYKHAIEKTVAVLEQTQSCLPERSFFSCGPSKAETKDYICLLIKRLNLRLYEISTGEKDHYWVIERLVGLNSNLRQLKIEAVGSYHYNRIQNLIFNDINTAIKNMSENYQHLFFDRCLLFEICYQAIAGKTFRSLDISSQYERSMEIIFDSNTEYLSQFVNITKLIFQTSPQKKIRELKKDTLLLLNQFMQDYFTRNILEEIRKSEIANELFTLNPKLTLNSASNPEIDVKSALKIGMQMFRSQKGKIAKLSAIECFKAMLLYTFVIKNITFNSQGYILTPKVVDLIQTPYFFGDNQG